MKIWCEACEGAGGIEYDWHNDCVVKTCEVCAGHGYTESDKPTTEINIDYYNELKVKADKWDEKETPFIPINQEYCGFVGMTGYCKCGKEKIVEEKYCDSCGQKLDWEGEGE